LTKFLNPPEAAAKRLNVSKPTLARWRCDGTGPKFVKVGGKVGYLDEDLDEYVERNRRVSTGSPRLLPDRNRSVVSEAEA
jgi:predicted DNA-binding transcriptional regulator AlpA